MFLFNFNFDSFHRKENSLKFFLISFLLIGLGLYCLIYTRNAIKFVSWSFAVVLLFVAYFNLKNINELSRYAPKEEIRPYKQIQAIILFTCLLLFLFPIELQKFIYLALGIFLLIFNIKKNVIVESKYSYVLTGGTLYALIFSVFLIIFPLFFSKLITIIVSLLIIFIGHQFLVLSVMLKRGDKNE
jgi:hypothetical protein